MADHAVISREEWIACAPGTSQKREAVDPSPRRVEPRTTRAALGQGFYLDITPKGRNETGPHHNLMDWVRHHDNYGFTGFVDATSLYRTGKVAYETARSADYGRAAP